MERRRRRAGLMATRRRPAADPPPEPNDELLDTRRDDDELDDGDDLDLVVEQLTGEAEYVVLWRIDGPTSKQEHVDKVPVSRFTAEYVKERHGGGDYIFRAYGEKQRGRPRKMQKYKEFSIDKSIPPKSGSAAVAWKDRRGPSEPATVLNESRRALPEWASTMLAATVPALVGAIVANLTREKVADPLLVELIRSNGKGSGSDPVALQALLADERARAIEIGKQIAGSKRRGGDDDDGMFTVIGQGIETLTEFAAGYRINAETEAKKAGASPSSDAARLSVESGSDAGTVGDVDQTTGRAAMGADASASIGAGGVVNGSVRPWVAAASPYMGMLPLAKKMQPGTAAALISDNLDDEEFADLMADIDDETNGGVLVRIPLYFPALGNVNIDWFRAVIDAIVESAELEEDPPTATDPPPALPEIQTDGQ